MGSRFCHRWGKVIVTALCLLAFCPFSPAQQRENDENERLFPREEEVLYGRVPNIVVRTIDGKTQRLSDWWQQRPILLTFVFAHCAGVCYPYLNSLRDAIRQVGGLGSDYEVVVLSFAPEDAPTELRLMAEALRLSRNERARWHFGVGEPEAMERLERAVGFWHRRIKGTNQYDHPAMLAAVKDGRVIRLLVGATVMPVRLREVVRELKGEPVLAYPLPDARMPFRCFRYDPKTGTWRPDWGLLALLTPPLLTAVFVLYVFRRSGCPRETESVRRSDKI
jgi:protein SCO1/2